MNLTEINICWSNIKHHKKRTLKEIMNLDDNTLKRTKKLGIYFKIIFFIIVIIGIFFIKIKSREDIIIGVSAQLTGSQAELGVQQRNGVQLAVEKINESGGISGRKISLMIQDDLGTPEGAQLVDSELIRDGAVAIIGHSTTAQTLEGLKVTDPANIIMVGATVSTPELSGLDDNFFRVSSSFRDSAQIFARHIYNDKKIRSIAIIYDRDNMAYSSAYVNTFADEFQIVGGKITDKVNFSSNENSDFFYTLNNLDKEKPEGLLIVASDIDTALIAQKAKIKDKQVSIFASAWAQTEALISNGGQAVEGIELEQAYNLDEQSSNCIDFKSHYKARFGSEPSFGAAYSYEATLVLAEALRKTHGSREGLKEALLEVKNFSVITDNLSFDKFGDIERPWYLTTIHNGKFIMIGKLTANTSGGGQS